MFPRIPWDRLLEDEPPSYEKEALISAVGPLFRCATTALQIDQVLA